ncbi:MAG: peptide/nickel transport system permease protein [Thermomicrobiales bacterium]|jgi:peptide/nickel transport system permease protein|nr:peptide/nickel transport system permease protein [Thermomicrobiales bacterium]MEA2586838.1 peptide/nickel transport system permease protein [Thermomicrobiales bacterium]
MGASLSYLAERVVIFVATIFISVSVVFFVPRLLPGDPLGGVYLKLAGVGGTAGQALVEDYRQRFGLDKSVGEQYVSYMRELARGNLGYSISSFPTRVSYLLKQAIPWTVGLLGVTTLISWILGSLLGAMVGWSGGRSRVLRGIVPIALVLYTTPYYILAIILIYLFAFHWTIFPLSGAYSVGADPALSFAFAKDVIRHGALPGLSIILVSLGWWFLSMRSLIISEQGQDYILWAEAKGLPRRRIFWTYAFRNALLPQTTGLALSLGHIVGGALITEVIFAYPGLGWLIYNAIKGLDFPVIQGSILLLIVSVAVANFVLELAYPLIDPRIRARRT